MSPPAEGNLGTLHQIPTPRDQPPEQLPKPCNLYQHLNHLVEAFLVTQRTQISWEAITLATDNPASTVLTLFHLTGHLNARNPQVSTSVWDSCGIRWPIEEYNFWPRHIGGITSWRRMMNPVMFVGKGWRNVTPKPAFWGLGYGLMSRDDSMYS